MKREGETARGENMALIKRDIYRKIEYYLYNHQEIKNEIEEQKKDIIESGRSEIGEIGRGQSFHSDPTALKAIRLCKDYLLEDEKWLHVIEHTKEKYQGTEKGKLLKLKYEQELGEIEICRELNISRATYFNWRQEIVFYTTMIATQKGLIRVA